MLFYVRERQTPKKLLIFSGVTKRDVEKWLVSNGEKGDIVEKKGEIHLFIMAARAEIVAKKLNENPLKGAS